jgi:signal transduction histidine kinase
MFEPWFTTKAPGRGTGLGLWLCRDIVEGLGGRIGFESGPSGTTFEVVLPTAI